MAGITLKNVTKEYSGGIRAVSDFSLEIHDREFVVLVGPSGCGKTTTLRMIAGLEEINSGEVYVGNQLINNVPAKDRDISMVFQSYALYPHMTIYKNMSYGLKLRKLPKDEIDERVHSAARMLNIEHLLSRSPRALSGGERQRVALGRAMVRHPTAFLFDEPLSNLDAKLRAMMRMEIKKLHEKLGTTFVFVTHDQTEAMTMGDRIVVMKDGVIQQADTPEAVYGRPKNAFCAGFIGSPQMNFLAGTLEKTGGEFALNLGSETLPLPPERLTSELEQHLSKPVRIGIRPENMYAHENQPAGARIGLITADIAMTELIGSDVFLYLNYEGRELTVRVPPGTTARSGQSTSIGIDMMKLHLFNAQTDEAIL